MNENKDIPQKQPPCATGWNDRMAVAHGAVVVRTKPYTYTASSDRSDQP